MIKQSIKDKKKHYCLQHFSSKRTLMNHVCLEVSDKQSVHMPKEDTISYIRYNLLIIANNYKLLL